MERIMRTKQHGLVVALAAGVLLGTVIAEAADRPVAPGAVRHHRIVKVRHVVRFCVDDRGAIKPTKHVRPCAVASALPPPVVIHPYW